MPGFPFIQTGPLQDGELSLRLTETDDADVPAYRYGIHLAGIPGEIGMVRLRPVTTPHLEHIRGHIGYGVDPAHQGHHYAERAVRLLFPLIRQHGVDPLWITCDPDNVPSRRICERLGGELVEIVLIPETDHAYERGHRKRCRYRIDMTANRP